MREVAIVLVLVSLVCASWPGLVALKRGIFPTTLAFGTFSILLYYGIGLLLELSGAPYTVITFSAFRAASAEQWVPACAVLMASPWLLILGGKLAGGTMCVQQLPVSCIRPSAQVKYYGLSIVSAIVCAWVGLSYALGSSSIWVARTTITEDFGPLIIVLYLPLHLLAFYCVQRDAQSSRGLLFLILMALAAIVGTLAIGQRTNALLPVLLILVFRGRQRLGRPLLIAVLLFCAASTLLPAFKSFDLYGAKSNLELINEGINGDLARGPILIEALARSEMVGTRVMPYPMAGYWYSLQFFVPRSLAIAKGLSTASYFTGAITGDAPERLSWGFGVGFIEEIALNIGVLYIAPGILLYGFVLALLDKASLRWPALVPATRLGAVWMAGYHLPALLMTFGVMAGVAWVCDVCFTFRSGPPNGAAPHLGEAVTRPRMRMMPEGLTHWRDSKGVPLVDRRKFC